ncbi:MAG: cadherin repeat domain-containing protein [Lachnospiraceae bacterium]|nr:cadherin repeat domain-containing protein [Lachnospiraceae bacterium]
MKKESLLKKVLTFALTMALTTGIAPLPGLSLVVYAAGEEYIDETGRDVWGGTAGRDGSKEHPYLITDTAGLDHLARRVNNDQSYGDYYELGADITYSHTTDWDDETSTENNYTPIGFTEAGNPYNYHPFIGSLDGKGHTISGIRVYKDGTDDLGDGYLGLFGVVYGDDRFPNVIKNITIRDTRITGFTRVGGIAGYALDYNISDCHVTDTVALHALNNGSSSFGGIAGYYELDEIEGTSISNCSSSVTMTVKGNHTTSASFGGIVGLGRGNVLNCLSVGVSIPALRYIDDTDPENSSDESGAVAGWYFVDESVFENNYYCNCMLDGTLAEKGIGVGSDISKADRHDISKISIDPYEYTDCAMPAFLISLPKGITADATTIGSYTAYKKGTEITLSGTGSIPAGYRAPFLGYTVKASDGTDVLVSQSGGKYTFTMPANNVTVSANWTVPTYYGVTVNNGTGSGEYEAGAKVTIKADNAPAGKEFDKWITSDGVAFADAGSAATSFTMPAKAVTVTATYKDVKPEPDITVTLSKTSYTYNGKVQKPKVTVRYKGKKLKTGNYTVTYPRGCKNVGTYTIKVKLKKGYSGTATADYTINKAKNPLSVKAKKPNVSYNKLTKEKQTLVASSVLQVTKARGKVTYEIVEGNENITIKNKSGKVTIAKDLPKATYKTKIKVTAAGDANYKPGSKTVTVKIKVK